MNSWWGRVRSSGIAVGHGIGWLFRASGIFARRSSLALASCLVLVFVGSGAAWAQPDTAPPTTLVILVDGLRADLVTRRAAPNLQRLGEGGARGAMTPIWPTLSGPNHWALVTGLDARHSGVWHNEMYHPAFGRNLEPEDQAWGFGEPIWATIAREGRQAGVIASWNGAWVRDLRAPSFYLPVFWVPETDALVKRVDIALETLTQTERPAFLALYVSSLDIALHEHGLGSAEADATLRVIDEQIGRLVDGLGDRGLSSKVNIVIVADHGHLNSVGKPIILEGHLDNADLVTPPVGGGPIYAIWPKPGREDQVYAGLRNADPHLKVYRADELPAEIPCCRGDRTPPILLVADDGYSIAPTRGAAEHAPVSSHGYTPTRKEMAAIFIAKGPGIRSEVKLAPFHNLDVYSLLAHLSGVTAQPNDGSILSLCGILTAPPRACAVKNGEELGALMSSR